MHLFLKIMQYWWSEVIEAYALCHKLGVKKFLGCSISYGRSFQNVMFTLFYLLFISLISIYLACSSCISSGRAVPLASSVLPEGFQDDVRDAFLTGEVGDSLMEVSQGGYLCSGWQRDKSASSPFCAKSLFTSSCYIIVIFFFVIYNEIKTQKQREISWLFRCYFTTCM